jgi:hypothetical protein
MKQLAPLLPKFVNSYPEIEIDFEIADPADRSGRRGT